MAKIEPSDLEWIQLRKDMENSAARSETPREKFIRKFNANPLVPVGCLLTTGALSYGLYSFKIGNRKLSQKMMRLRVAAQGFTIAALVVGVVLTADKLK